MKALTRMVRNEYFPAAAVLVSVVLFWVRGSSGDCHCCARASRRWGLCSGCCLFTPPQFSHPFAGLLAVIDLLRRRARKRRRPVAFHNLSSLQGAAEAAGSATRGGKAGP